MTLSLAPSQIRDFMIFSHRHISLELRVGADRDTELQEMLEDEAHSPFNYVLEKSIHQDLHGLLSRLSSQQREVKRLRFGFTDGHELSLAQIGHGMGITRERVR
ncbi:sigma factor-like helix-turn-helix DNA-binding protein [Tolypothrix campylonemoides VB511288_2]|uniref:Sigma factor-like helix-turn-helix DNA-binding protein n=2 Tax=Nostocales TaxID=1161 RepID=A0ABW8X118_9CYAN|nr:sigma factor-like helix-turn-helix DNA-binding protein [Tolypothrix bouteillei]